MVEVRLRPGIADPEGATIERSLPALGFEGMSAVKMGKAIRLVVDAPNETTAAERIDQLCRRFLANPVIEDVEVTLDPHGGP